MELKAPPAFVSKRIAILENALGVRLFHRAARRVTMTDDGERVYASAQQIFQGVGQVALKLPESGIRTLHSGANANPHGAAPLGPNDSRTPDDLAALPRA